MNFVQPIRDPKKIEAMKEVLGRTSDRNRMLFITGINSGLRISDILKLKVKDVKGVTHLTIKEKKTGKRTPRQMTPNLRRAVREYTKGMAPDDYLFCSNRGTNKPLGRHAVYKFLRKAADEVGIRDIGTHSMRKTFGYHLYKKNKDVAVLQQIFNHSWPATTLRYIGVDQDKIDSEIESFGL